MLKVNAKSGEIFLYGVVGSAEYGGDFGFNDVQDALDQLNGAHAHVRINSVGGVVDEGIPIYGLLSRYEGGVTTYNDSLAASIASIIMLASKDRVTAKGSRWMVHRAIGGTAGNVQDMERYLNQLRAYDQSMEEIYKSALGDSIDIGAMLDAETWFTAEAAIESGLATKIEGDAKAKPRVAAWFKNSPVDLIAACADEPVVKFKKVRLPASFYTC